MLFISWIAVYIFSLVIIYVLLFRRNCHLWQLIYDLTLHPALVLYFYFPFACQWQTWYNSSWQNTNTKHNMLAHNKVFIDPMKWFLTVSLLMLSDCLPDFSCLPLSHCFLDPLLLQLLAFSKLSSPLRDSSCHPQDRPPQTKLPQAADPHSQPPRGDLPLVSHWHF